MMPLWAATTALFLRSYETRSAGCAALAGLAAAAAMLGKYWSVVLLLGLGLAALADRAPRRLFPLAGALGDDRGRRRRRSSPHVAWLYANDFTPFAYAMEIASRARCSRACGRASPMWRARPATSRCRWCSLRSRRGRSVPRSRDIVWPQGAGAPAGRARLRAAARAADRLRGRGARAGHLTVVDRQHDAAAGGAAVVAADRRAGASRRGASSALALGAAADRARGVAADRRRDPSAGRAQLCDRTTGGLAQAVEKSLARRRPTGRCASSAATTTCSTACCSICHDRVAPLEIVDPQVTPWIDEARVARDGIALVLPGRGTSLCMEALECACGTRCRRAAASKSRSRAATCGTDDKPDRFVIVTLRPRE